VKDTSEVVAKLQVVAQDRVVCPRCEAKPGEECESLSGDEARQMHTSRVQPLMQAYVMGHDDATNELSAPPLEDVAP
jgi:hypothetical protein